MSNTAFSQLFSRWVNRVRRPDAPRDPRRGRARLRVETMEDRVTPATTPPQVIPAVTVTDTRLIGTPTPPGTTKIDRYDGTGDFQPQVVADPTDPNTLVYVASTGGTNLYGQYTHDGGANWLPFTFNFGNPAANLPLNNGAVGNFRDPTVAGPTVYSNGTNPSIAMGRDGTVYIAYLLHDATKTSGAVALRSFTFTTPTTLTQFNATQILYRWQGQDPALNVTVAIDNNPSDPYTDPTSAATTQRNTNTNKAVYVAWNTNALRPSIFGYANFPTPGVTGFNPNTVWLAASRDRGVSFSTPVQVNDASAIGDGYFYSANENGQTAADAASVSNPLIVFSSDNVNPYSSVTQGQMNVFFSRVNNRTTRFDNSTPDGGVLGQQAVENFSFAGGGGGTPIAEAGINPAGGDHIPTTTSLTTTVTFPAGGFNLSTDFNVGISLSHPHMNQVSITLAPPNGSGLPTLTLLTNRRLANGNDKLPINGVLPGLADVANLGIINFNNGFTDGVDNTDSGANRGGLAVFDQEGPRWLIDPVNVNPYIANFRPEPGTNLNAYYGKTAAQLSGTWTLNITDFRDDDGNPGFTPNLPIPHINAWSLRITSRLSNSRFGLDATVEHTPGTIPAPNDPERAGVDFTNFPLPFLSNPANPPAPVFPAVSPTLSVGPGISVAYDNSFGTSSPSAIGGNGSNVFPQSFGGRMYIAYTAVGGGGADSDIYLVYSDTNGQAVAGTRPDGQPFTQWSVPIRVNTDDATDNVTEGNRTQFQPTVAVDQATGTVVVSWYDGRLDASNARTVRYVATSIDGGQTFSKQVFLNNPKVATDAITNQSTTIEPVPGNLVNAGAFGFGTRQSMVVYNGRINAFWTGNENSNGVNAYTATARFTSGPRIVSSDMGSVTTENRFRVGQRAVGATPPTPLQDVYFEYNNTFAADGTRQIDGILVRFDRPINLGTPGNAAAGIPATPSTFNAADINVQFRSPNLPLGTPGTTIALAGDPELLEWSPAGTVVDDTPDFVPNTVFFIRFATPQSAVGTYSYSIGSNIQDRIQNPGASGPNQPSSDVTLVAPTAPFDAPFVNTTGGAITTGTLPGAASTGTINSTVTVPALPPGQVIGQVVVDVNISHTRVGDLRITLIAPFNDPATGNPFTITLYGLRAAIIGGNGDNLTNTRFEDSGSRFIFREDVAAPYSGSYRPETSGPLGSPNQPVQSLAALIGRNPLGTWTLRVADVDGSLGVDGDTGTGALLNWALTILPGHQNTTTSPALGNFLDQNADGQSLQLPSQFSPRDRTSDTYSIPSAINGTPYTIPYAVNTQPILEPGPHVTAISTVNNLPAVTSAVFQAAFPTTAPFPVFPFLLPTVGVGSVIVTFDRDINPYSVEADARDLTSLTLNGTVLGGGFRITPLYNPSPLSANYPPPPPPPVGTPTKTYRITRTGAPLTAGTYVAKFGTGIQPTDNLVLNAGATSVDVTFDRDIAVSTFTPADVIRMTGPIGGVAGPFTVTAVNPVAGAAKTFRVGFPAQTLQGPYSIEFGSNIATPAGVLLDNNFNAGLEVLRGNGQPLVGANPVATYTTAPGPITIPANGTVSLTLNVPDEFTIDQNLATFPNARIQVLLNIMHPNTPDLIGKLVSPTGQEIILFSQVGTQGAPNQTNFENTRFDDASPSPIQTAQPPFDPGAGAYSPQQPLSTPLLKTSSKGDWKLVVSNLGVNAGTLVNFSLTLPFLVTGNGLGEPNADRFTAGFRSFIQDPTNPQSQTLWTPVGPTSTNQVTQTNANGTSGLNNSNNAGRVTGLAVDTSDPSGNTVFAGGASGGVWKTTNFLTTNPEGPVWIPLTDFGPTTSLNIGSIAVFPRNNDPNQTIVFALTGEGDERTRGVGVLRSLDGGRTWVLLDSTNNVDASGAVLPVTNQPPPAVQRDHLFTGTTGFKILVDPKLNPANKVIVYMAVSDPLSVGNAVTTKNGIWRSSDGGDTWERIQAGEATDFVLAAGSAGANGNLQFGYGAIQGQGVFFTSQAPDVTAGGMLIRNGGEGNGLIQDALTQLAIPVSTTTGPGGARGRISLAAPVLTNDPLANTFYRSWVYALVADQQGNYDGLFMSKDDGRNWTRVLLPLYELFNNGVRTRIAYGTNDETRPEHDIFAKDEAGTPGATVGKRQGNETMSVTIDPTNPNIVYLGGMGAGNDAPLPIGGLVRVDTTLVNSQQTFDFYDNSAGGVGPLRQVYTLTGGAIGNLNLATADPIDRLQGSLNVALNNPNGGIYETYDTTAATVIPTGFLNLLRDPLNPFLSNSTLRVNDTETTPGLGFTNNGNGATYMPFLQFIQADDGSPLAVDIHRLISIVDPVTGTARLIAGTDQGVYTGVDAGDGTLSAGIGGSKSVARSRNGNLQIGQFYSGAVQPSQLSADVARAMFYAVSRDNGFPVSSSNALTSGNSNWNGQLFDPGIIKVTRFVPEYRDGSGTNVAVDQTGSGTAYEFRWPCCLAVGEPLTDFFRVLPPGTGAAGGVSRTNGLVLGQNVDVPINDQGQWPIRNENVGYFAVNPIDPRGMVIGSSIGRVYRTTDQGGLWSQIASPAQLDGTIVRALAYGAPTSASTGQLNNFIYAGTLGGKVFVTETGQAPWTNISAGLDGTAAEPVLQIVANPRRGTRDAFAVTPHHVYYRADIRSGTWIDITANLFQLNRTVFGRATDTAPALDPNGRGLMTIAADWRYQIPVNPADPNSATFPVLYVGGDGGVFRTKTALATGGPVWTFYPDVANEGSVVEGGYLPNAVVTDLDLSIGNLDPASGLPLASQTGGLNLLVATTFGRGQFAIRLDPNLPTNSAVSGPRVTQVTNPNPAGGPSTLLNVTFSGPVDPVTFSPADVVLKDPNGNNIPVTSVTLISPNGANGANPRNVYQIAFASQSSQGIYTLSIGADATGPMISDLGGNLMNQNGNTVNGEPIVDAYTSSVFLNGTTTNNLQIVLPGIPATVTAGTSVTFTVRAVDQNGNTITGLTGPVSITSSDPAFTLVTVNPQLTNGVGQYTVIFRTSGPQSVTVAFSAGGLNPVSGTTTVLGAAAGTFELVDSPDPVTAGSNTTFTVIARDQFGNVASGYNGTVTITSDDASPQASVPASVVLTNGQGTFVANFVTAGLRTTAVADATNAAITGGTTTTVTPQAANRFIVSATPLAVQAGGAITFTVTAIDQFDNIDTNYNGPITVGNTDPAATVMPANPVLTNGTGTYTVTFRTIGTQTVTVINPANPTVTGSVTGVAVTAVPPPPLPPTPTTKLPTIFAVGSATGGSPNVQVYNPDGSPQFTFTPFPAGFAGQVDPFSEGFTGGHRVAVGDVTGDGVADVVVGTGPTISSFVKVYSGATRQEVLVFQPFEASFKGGVFVSVGDIDGDGISDIGISPDVDGGPRVTLLKGGSFNGGAQPVKMADFFGIDDPAFRGGVRTSIGDINGDGKAELVVAAGNGGGPRISVYDGAALGQGRFVHPIGDFFIFEQALRDGAYVTVGDLDGDGFGDIIGGGGPSGGPRVFALSGQDLLNNSTRAIANFFAGDPNNRGGIQVTAKNLDGDRFADLITGDGTGAGSRVTAFRGSSFLSGDPVATFGFDAYPGFNGGVFVG